MPVPQNALQPQNIPGPDYRNSAEQQATIAGYQALAQGIESAARNVQSSFEKKKELDMKLKMHADDLTLQISQANRQNLGKPGDVWEITPEGRPVVRKKKDEEVMAEQQSIIKLQQEETRARVNAMRGAMGLPPIAPNLPPIPREDIPPNFRGMYDAFQGIQAPNPNAPDAAATPSKPKDTKASAAGAPAKEGEIAPFQPPEPPNLNGQLDDPKIMDAVTKAMFMFGPEEGARQYRQLSGQNAKVAMERYRKETQAALEEWRTKVKSTVKDADRRQKLLDDADKREKQFDDFVKRQGVEYGYDVALAEEKSAIKTADIEKRAAQGLPSDEELRNFRFRAQNGLIPGLDMNSTEDQIIQAAIKEFQFKRKVMEGIQGVK